MKIDIERVALDGDLEMMKEECESHTQKEKEEKSKDIS
jgi:hypothetical protein